MFTDEFKKKKPYSEPDNFLCDKQLRDDLVQYLNNKYKGQNEIRIDDISALFKPIAYP